MWYIITGCVITLILAVMLMVDDYNARKMNPNTPDMPAILAVGLIGCVVAWPIIIIASIPLLFEIIKDLIDYYKLKKKYKD